MRIAFVINALATERSVYTTTGLAMEAHGRDHEVWYVPVDRLGMALDRSVQARASRVPSKAFRSREKFIEAVREAEPSDVVLDDFDVVWLRNDPGSEPADRSWAKTTGIAFGLLLAERGVLVLNDPAGLIRAASKMYLRSFPDSVCPRTVITRDVAAVRSFIEDEGNDIILKPLQGSGGDRVFVVRADDGANLNQIFEAVAESGYVIAQEFLPAAKEGDIRFFLMNGRPLEVDGHYAAFKRIQEGDDPRNNMSVGGRAEAVTVTSDMLAMAEVVRPRLVEHGMFLVGLDIAGDKILEINVYSPGGLNSCSHLEGVDFHPPVIDAVEAKLGIRDGHQGTIANGQLATL